MPPQSNSDTSTCAAQIELLQLAIESIDVAVICVTADGRLAYANAAAHHLLGTEKMVPPSESLADFDLGLDRQSWAEIWQKLRTNQSPVRRTRCVSRDGREFTAEMTMSYTAAASGEFCCICIKDVSAQTLAEDLARLAVAIYMSGSEAVVITDEENRIVQINPAFSRITGYTLDDLYGQNPRTLHSALHDAAFYQEMWQQLLETGNWQGELWDRRKSGELFASWVTISLIRHPDGSIFRHVAQFSDITERKKKEDQLWQQANFDVLTGLPNRRLFNDRLEQEIKKSNRAGHQLCLLFIDLDDFKMINDQFGHDRGDSLLIEAAQRISRCVRSTDTVARMGGDEFTVILPEFNQMADVERIVQAIIRELNAPFSLGTNDVTVSASIGIALYPVDAQDISNLLVCADQAMYQAKKTGQNRYAYALAEVGAQTAIHRRNANHL